MPDHIIGAVRVQSPIDRFWKYVDDDRPLSDCWEWTGATRNGYGVLRVEGKTIYAHRFSYELHYEPLKEGQCVLHRCDNPLCCNAYHLFAGTKSDNARDMYAKGRANTANNYGGPKVTEQEVREIRQLAAQGIKYPALATRFGISIPAISLIVTRKRWSHVP